jgi:serine protease
VGPTGSTSYLTFWPAGETRPNASQITFKQGDKLSNYVTVKLGAGGAFQVFNKNGNTDVIVDVAGYYV